MAYEECTEVLAAQAVVVGTGSAGTFAALGGAEPSDLWAISSGSSMN